jgi:secretion/DNA translocation related TadE-like protein
MKNSDQRGAATTAVIGLLLVITVIFSFSLAGIGILINKHKLNSATDLAALSAAYRLPEVEIACQLAQSQLAKSGFTLILCDGDQDWVTIVSRQEITVFSQPIRLTAEATAGW